LKKKKAKEATFVRITWLKQSKRCGNIEKNTCLQLGFNNFEFKFLQTSSYVPPKIAQTAKYLQTFLSLARRSLHAAYEWSLILAMAIVGRAKYTHVSAKFRGDATREELRDFSKFRARARVYFARSTIAIAKIRDYSQSSLTSHATVDRAKLY